MASLTYINETGGTEQRDVTLPWIFEISRPKGAQLYLSAQKKFENHPYDLRARIRRGQEVLQTADSTAPYGVASVGGLVP